MNALSHTVCMPAFHVITCRVTIQRPIDDAWLRVGGFADAGRFLNVLCELVSGDGGIGSVRRVGDSILEVLVGKTDYSYTYSQTAGPMERFAYHGCVSLTPVAD